MGYGSGIVTIVTWVSAVTQVRSLAQEQLYAMGAAKKKKKKKSIQNLYVNVHSSLICYSSKLEMTQMSINR